MRNILLLILIRYILIFSLFSEVQAQKHNNIWYFGENAGLDFNGGQPIPLTDGALISIEGCTTISDEEGNVLFYSNGNSVWNRMHQKIPSNVGDLPGNAHTTQSSLIVPWPGKVHVYFLFMLNWQGKGGVSYTVIDLTADKVNFKITNKHLLFSPTTEKISATLHSNEQHIWIVGHLWNSNEFIAYLITENGIEPNPVISAVGSEHRGGTRSADGTHYTDLNTLGYMKVSQDGNKLALAVEHDAYVEIFDFDNQTGVVSNPVRLNFTGEVRPYGIEFSPDSRLLYVSTYPKAEIIGDKLPISKLFQYSLDPFIENEIIDSQQEIGITLGYNGALQLGPDQKIYLARNGVIFLGVINTPNAIGNDADFDPSGVNLSGKQSQLGLPPLVVVPKIAEVDFSYQNTCYTQETTFALDADEYEQVNWNFGDPSSDAANTSQEENPGHTFSAPGIYTVEVSIVLKGVEFSESKEITIHPQPSIALGNDTTLLYGTTLLLTAPQEEGLSYSWQDGSTGSTFTVTEPGTYRVEVTDQNGCSWLDSISVNYEHILDFDLGADTTLCENEILTLDATVEGATYQWQDGSADPSFTITEAGIYWVDVTDAYGQNTVRDSITVDYASLSPPEVSDLTVCDPEEIMLSVTKPNPALTYQWFFTPDSTTPIGEGTSIMVTLTENEQTFYVAATQGRCKSAMSQLNVTLEEPMITAEANPTTIEAGESTSLQAEGGNSYQWSPSLGLSNPNVDNPIATPDTTTVFVVTGTTEHGCQGSAEVTITVIETDPPDTIPADTTDNPMDPTAPPINADEVKIPNVFTPNDDGVNDTWEIINLQKYPSVIIKVYSRWGEEVFSAQGVHQPWDGSFQSKLLPADVYFYVIDFNNSEQPSRTGHVTLIR